MGADKKNDKLYFKVKTTRIDIERSMMFEFVSVSHPKNVSFLFPNEIQTFLTNFFNEKFCVSFWVFMVDKWRGSGGISFKIS